MTRRKTDKYEFSNQAENVIERGNHLYTSIKGKWHSDYFKNSNPLVLELACGKGEYSIGLAQQFPEKNFIGIDIKGDRIARGSKIATGLGLQNVAFLRASIKYLDEFFGKNEVSEIWLIHPDPHVRERDEKKRLTNPQYLNLLKEYLIPGGFFHLKTDSPELYDYSIQTLTECRELEIIDKTSDLYNSNLNKLHYDIVTHYEGIFVKKGFKINYIKALKLKEAS